MTYRFHIYINNEKPKWLEEFSWEAQEEIRKTTFSQLAQALGYEKEETA